MIDLAVDWVKIGNQYWTNKNYDVPVAGKSISNPAHPTWGLFYTGSAIADINAQLAGTGWRVPTRDDFLVLQTAVGTNGGYHLSSTTEWDVGPGDDIYGFNAKPGGYTYPGTEEFTDVGAGFYFWINESANFADFYRIMARRGYTLGLEETQYSITAHEAVRLVRDTEPPSTAPSASPPAGSYRGTQYIALSSPVVGATIHYTLDGSVPTASSPVYTGLIELSTRETVTLSAISVRGTSVSKPMTAIYTIGADSLVGLGSVTLTQTGVTKLRVKAVSQSGIVAYSEVVSVAVDTLPTLIFEPALPSRIRVRGLLPVKFRVSDLEGDNIGFTLMDNGVPLISGTISRESLISFDWSPAVGPHSITIQLTDGMLTTSVVQGPVVTVIPYRNINET